MLDKRVNVCYNKYRKKEREENKMKYVVTGFRFNREFTNEIEAKACFNAVKYNFTYCELKRVDENGTRYYAESLKIFRK